MTTKETERKALEQIKKILATLDKDGWVNIAFEGAVEHAEENIENDFGCSWKNAAESIAEKMDNVKSDNEKLQKELKAANERIAALEAKTFDRQTLNTCYQAITVMAADFINKEKEYAANIVKLADDPESEAFKNAVYIHRVSVRTVNKYKEAEQRVAEIMKAE